MLRSSRHINMLSLSHSLETWKNRDEKSDKLKNYKSLRTLECYHSGLKAMDPNATWCIHPWSPCFLHTQLPYSLQAAGSACLALLAVEQSHCTYSSTQVLTSFPLVGICMYVQGLSFCPCVQCRWMQTGYCCLTVGEFVFMGEHVLEALWFLVCGAGRRQVLWGQLQLHSPLAQKQRSAGFTFSRLEHVCWDIMVFISSDFF